jgi:hypothetical protein
MTDHNVFPYYIRVPRASVEKVPPDRHDAYYVLGEWLLDERKPQVKMPHDSIYLTPEQMTETPGEIRKLLRPPVEPKGRLSLIIFDLADNHYHQFRENFFRHIAEVAAQWLRDSERRRIVIMLPFMPPPTSLFWLDSEEDNEGESRLTVVADTGASTPRRLLEDSRRDYRNLLRPTRRDLRARLRSRIIRKPGHYDFSSRADPHCARFYYEIEAAEREIGDLVRNWVEDDVKPLIPGERLTLLSHGKGSPKFHEAVAGAAVATDCTIEELLADGPPFLAKPIEAPAALVLNVVHTGRTFRSIVDDLRARGVRLVPKALTVMTTDQTWSRTDDLPDLEILCASFDRHKMSRDRCEQCLIGLPHTEPKEDSQIGLRAFDMWDILRRTDFKEETFGPKRTWSPFIPDMEKIFDDHGTWLAYKIGELLEWLNIGSNAVFVAPQEPHIERLVERLGELRQNKQITVRIPRVVLNSTHLERTLRNTVQEDWHRQLRHLGKRNFGEIVMLDEFVMSYRTAKAMLRLLRRNEFGEFGLTQRAFIPIVDFSLMESPIPDTYPLYKLPRP